MGLSRGLLGVILGFIMQELNGLKLELIQKISNLNADELHLFLEKANSIIDEKITAKMGIVEFTEKELNSMPKNIKRLLVLDKKRCRLRTVPSGKNSVTYEIRLRRDGYNITACGKTIELAKANFLKKLRNADNPAESSITKIPTRFDDFAQFYFLTFRKEKVSEATFKTDVSRYNLYLLPYFNQYHLTAITPTDCKRLLDRIKADGKGKTADEIYSLMNVIFKFAIAHGIINRNPLDIVFHTQHERESGKALTKDEEQRLKSAFQGSYYLQSYMVLLYTGLRPNELKTAQIQSDFIVAVNSKRKNKKVAYKKIPIINALKPYLSTPLNFASLNKLREKLKTVLPNHILYDLRTTFYTRCDEYGVSIPARDEFVGHSSGALTNAYRNLSDEYLLNEGKKLDKWI